MLLRSERVNAELGHENLGSLSTARGFLTLEAPRLELPPQYQPWRELAARLPALHRTLALRRAVDGLPTLTVGPDELPDRCLARAASLLGILAHAYGHLLPGPACPPPPALQRPWDQVSARLGRKATTLTYVDVILQNWRYRGAATGGPVRLDRVDLATPTVGTEAERVFYLAQVELLDRAAPLLAAVARAQEAVLADEVDVLRDILAELATLLRRVSNETFAQVDPNEHSDTHVDPVLWAKTVASLAIPLRAGVIGPGGASSPVVHVLDALFERHVYRSSVGHESMANRRGFPKHWQDFIRATGAVSIRDYVEERGDPSLAGLFNAAFYAYASDHGFLGRHRLKVYGFLDLAFKVGRNQTNSGFTGLYRERPWDMVDDELDRARKERMRGFPPITQRATVKRVTTRGDRDGAAFSHVVLDVADSGIRYEPGDRVGVLPENSPALVERTLQALQADGGVAVPLNREWREAVQLRAAVDESDPDEETLPLRQLLAWGRIRPVERPVAKGLYRLTRNRALHRIVEARAEDQWELWDVLELLSRSSFDTRRLWRAGPGEREYICRFVRPLPFRMYSIASAMRSGGSDEASELHLTVGRLRYRTQDTGVSRAATREGTASSFLSRFADAPEGARRPIALRVIHPPRFGLPREPARPIVMFAAGTGIAPFFGFLDARRGDRARDWLFYATRSRASFFQRERLERRVAAGGLEVRVAFSRDDVEARFDPAAGRFVFEAGARHRVAREIAKPENAAALRSLLRSPERGGAGAYVYVCGQTGFASSVMRSLKRLLRPEDPELDEPARAAAAEAALQRLVASGRYAQEIFSTYEGPQTEKERLIDASEVVLRNNPEDGYWMILSGLVYDMTEFAGLHPGGAKIIASYAGIDATQAYRKVEHHLNAEVDAMRGMYELGAVRRLDFGGLWGVTLGAKGLEFIALADVYRRWIRYLYRIVEMENALRNDLSLRARATTRGEPEAAATPYKSAFTVSAHARFMSSYVDGLVGRDFDRLWSMTCGLCSRDTDVRWGGRAIAALRASDEGRRVDGLPTALALGVGAMVERGLDGPVFAGLDAEGFHALCDQLASLDLQFLVEYKRAAREVVMVFERRERETLTRAAGSLLAATRALPGVLARYCRRVAELIPEPS